MYSFLLQFQRKIKYQKPTPVLQQSITIIRSNVLNIKRLPRSNTSGMGK